MLIVQGTLPPATASDVATQEVTLSITPAGGGDPVVTVITKPVAETTFTFNVDVGATILASLVQIDGSGNRSAATESGPFVAADTFPPPAPGAIGFTVVGQE